MCVFFIAVEGMIDELCIWKNILCPICMCVRQEIKLERVRPDDKLGLTLCDGLPVNRTRSDEEGGKSSGASPDETRAPEEDQEEEDNEVYIQAIADESLAAADGRLSQGDILLQVFFFLSCFHQPRPARRFLFNTICQSESRGIFFHARLTALMSVTDTKPRGSSPRPDPK